MHAQHAKQAIIGYMFRPISHHHAHIMDIKKTLDGAIGMRSPPLHIIIIIIIIIIHYKCICL